MKRKIGVGKVCINGESIDIEDIEAIAHQEKEIFLEPSESYQNQIHKGSAFLGQVLQEQGQVYGVTTGYGDSCSKTVVQARYYDLPVHLTRFHGCGLGRYFDPPTTRAIIATRLQSLGLGYSGVSYGLLQALENLLKYHVLPLIPEEGSVGASGDLTPLSYIGGALIGERDVLYQGKVRPAAEVLQELRLPIVKLRPKEGLAIMNGTAVMTALACLAFKRAEYLADMACKITAMVSLAMQGNAYHFDRNLFRVKPHQGQILVAGRIRKDLGFEDHDGIMPERIQDAYSLRCAPHVIGVFYDALPMLRGMIENELNSVNDNPVIDPESRSILHGGHFYGGHIAFAMDSLKNIVANIADLLDRQFALLVDEKFNRNLPPNLSGSQEDFSLNHGFKAVQIGVSAWTAETLKNAIPASIFSRSTECHNQDKVSLGTIAARDCIRSIELSEQVLSACLLGAYQAIQLRLMGNGDLHKKNLHGLAAICDQVAEHFTLLTEDRPLENDLRHMMALTRQRYWELGYEKSSV